jgi:hypothetical protein
MAEARDEEEGFRGMGPWWWKRRKRAAAETAARRKARRSRSRSERPRARDAIAA